MAKHSKKTVRFADVPSSSPPSSSSRRRRRRLRSAARAKRWREWKKAALKASVAESVARYDAIVRIRADRARDAELAAELRRLGLGFAL